MCDEINRNQIARKNILKLHGVPVGEIYTDAVNNAIVNANQFTADENSASGPKEYVPSALQYMSEEELHALVRAANEKGEDPDSLSRRRAAGEFYKLMREAGLMPSSDNGKVTRVDLSAEAGVLAPPQNNAGLYQGRIEQIDPTRYNTIDVHPRVNQHRDHNMTNITFPSLNEDEQEGDEDEVPEPGTEDDSDEETDYQSQKDETVEENDNGELASYTDASPADRVYVAMSEDFVEGPERIRFEMMESGDLRVEAAGELPSSWWRSLSPERKRAYLDRHPNSKYAKAYRRKLAAKKLAAKKTAKRSKKGSSVSDLDESAKENTENTTPIPGELSNDQDSALDQVVAEMDDSDLDDLDDNSDQAQEESGGDEDSEDTSPEGASSSAPPPIDPDAARGLSEAASRPGFFRPVVSAIKKRASNSTLGAMGRFVKGNMREGDRDKAIRGISMTVAAMTVVGVGIGLAAIGGPGLMMKYVTSFVDGFGGDGDGFDFSGEASDEKKPKNTEDVISDENLEALSKKFVEWLQSQADAQHEEQ